jgi:hypothetical protein
MTKNHATRPVCAAADHVRGRRGPSTAVWVAALLWVGCAGPLASVAWGQPTEAAVPPAEVVGNSAVPVGVPYQVDVWADALFGTDGQLQRLEVPDAEQYPEAFVQRLKQRFAQARIPPVTDDSGAPATFQTGLGMYLTVTPAEDGGAGTVRIDSVRVAARPVKRYAASVPDNIPSTAGSGAGQAAVSLQCTVQGDGRCTDVTVVSATVGSESLRRWGVASMEGWRFEPQRVNGQPVPSQWQQTLTLEVLDTLPKDFRDPLRIR